MTQPTIARTDVSRLPNPGDNVAIAIRRLEAGTSIDFGGAVRRLAHTVLEGHRFAVKAIAPGEALTSWGFPFGVAVAAISEGDYVCNDSMLKALAVRQVGGTLPEKPNFADRIEPFNRNALFAHVGSGQCAHNGPDCVCVAAAFEG